MFSLFFLSAANGFVNNTKGMVSACTACHIVRYVVLCLFFWFFFFPSPFLQETKILLIKAHSILPNAVMDISFCCCCFDSFVSLCNTDFFGSASGLSLSTCSTLDWVVDSLWTFCSLLLPSKKTRMSSCVSLFKSSRSLAIFLLSITYRL